MPELPEVQTTASGLNRVIEGISPRPTITHLSTDYKGPDFKKKIIGKVITHVTRRGKNVLIHLSDDLTLLVHMKMTGHLLYGDYDRSDPFNRHIHLIISLSNGKTIELSDARRFAKIVLIKTSELPSSIHLAHIGPEPLEKSCTFSLFKKRIFSKSHNMIKPVITDQSIIAGIGNIYADESLWRAGIHPEELVEDIPETKLKKLFRAVKTLLAKGIDFGGDSMSDYRNVHGKPGKFQEQHQAYRKTGKKCSKRGCAGYITRIVVAGRGTHFCPTHQKLSK